MEKDIENLVLLRCENYLQQHAEYIELQNSLLNALEKNDLELYSELSIKIQIVVEYALYKLGISDATRMQY